MKLYPRYLRTTYGSSGARPIQQFRRHRFRFA